MLANVALFYFVLLFHLTIYVLVLLYIPFFLICRNFLILKNCLIKIFKLRCSQQDFCTFRLTFYRKLVYGFYLYASLGRIIVWRKNVNVKKISIYCWSNTTCREFRFLEWRKQNGERIISTVLVVHLQKFQIMLKSVRGNG